jgi:hypothetical protein
VPYDPAPVCTARRGVTLGDAVVMSMAPPSPDRPNTPRCTWTSPPVARKSARSMKNNSPDSASLSGAPFSITRVRAWPKPRIEKYEYPMPLPLSLEAYMPGTSVENSIAGSCPQYDSATCSCGMLVKLTASTPSRARVAVTSTRSDTDTIAARRMSIVLDARRSIGTRCT